MYKLMSSLVVVIAIGAGLVITYYVRYNVPELPKFDVEKWWGIGSKPKEEDTSVRIFKIDFNDTVRNNSTCDF